MAGIALLRRLVDHGPHFLSVGRVDDLPQVIEYANFLDALLGTKGVDGAMQSLRLVLEHIVAHTSFDGLTNETGVPYYLLYQLISLGVDVDRGVNANN